MKTSLAHVGSRFMIEAALKNSRAKGSLPISAGPVGTTYKQQQQDESQRRPEKAIPGGLLLWKRKLGDSHDGPVAKTSGF